MKGRAGWNTFRDRAGLRTRGLAVDFLSESERVVSSAPRRVGNLERPPGLKTFFGGVRRASFEQKSGSPVSVDGGARRPGISNFRRSGDGGRSSARLN